ncbi:FAD-dependent oxidoreductase [Pelomonas sp. KK5]|uniref:FAD-dependent oxidoreductase n=1 Tax=Pelomonas sp. KK5 TaxID=1855730 RepID=UPI00097BB9F8|nr:FAD-dependent oxidoreductase [Pelomonas sp. KK5]
MPYRSSSWIARAEGEGHLQAVTLADGQRTECDELGVGFGLLPSTELAAALGCRIDAESGAIAVDIAQQTSQPHILAAGECCGIGGADKALIEGEIAALQILGEDIRPLAARHRRQLAFAARLHDTFTPRPELLRLADPGTMICRCEDVSLGRLRAEHGWREAKLQTRCGMGACQGRICKPIAHELLGWHAEETTPREPLQPAPLRAFVSLRPAAEETPPAPP